MSTRLEEWINQQKAEPVLPARKAKCSVNIRLYEEDFLYLTKIAEEMGYTRSKFTEKIMALCLSDIRSIWEKKEKK